MPLTAGVRLGPYHVVATLGAGGMGQVYRARDTQLDRDVALKVLPEAFTTDPDRLARFQCEAKVLASLNHPHIAQIYGFEEADGVQALVLELVEGPTLADRLAHGPIAPDDALPIARQIAEALEAAHEQGVVHRDLKPANIKVRPDGTVKVLDFGLAKLVASEPGTAAGELSQSPTLTTPVATRVGVVLGTAAYMSPEQAKGKPVDKRADIWAFGCVLYEMLSGRRAFRGEDVSDTLAAILKDEPHWAALPPDTPSSIRALLSRCLQKDVKKRTRDAGDIVLELDSRVTPAGASAAPVPVSSLLSRRSLLVGLAAVLLGGLIVGFAAWLRQQAPSAPVTRLTMRLPPGQRLAGLGQTAMALSPDGRRLVYVASAAGQQQLYVREMDSFEATPIAGTEGAEYPFFSPDGQWVGFFTYDRLKKVPISGGPPVVLARVSEFGRGASWGNDGNIVFSSGAASGLSLVSASGGTPQALTELNRQTAEGSHRFPHHVPTGAVVFTVGTGGAWDDARIEVLELDTRGRKVLIHGGSDGQYLAGGHLVYLRAGTLMAVPMDLERLEVVGFARALVEGVLPSTDNRGAAQASFARDALLYVPGTGASNRVLTWVDRTGAEQPLDLPPRAYRHPRLSPDGDRLVFDIDSGNRGDVWVYDFRRRVQPRLTVEGFNMNPVWTPDGTKVVFWSNRTGRMNLFWRTADLSGPEERLTTSEDTPTQGAWSSAWSPDEKTIAFGQMAPDTGFDIWTLDLDDGRKARPFLQTPFNEANPAFSPDGRLIAYQSDESGRDEVYVQPFPGPGGKELVSVEGGTDPVWSRDGRELFYRSGDSRMMAVATTMRPSFRASNPNVLFERAYWSAYSIRNYDVTSNGRRFLMIKETEQTSSAVQINVVLNWHEELARLVPPR